MFAETVQNKSFNVVISIKRVPSFRTFKVQTDGLRMKVRQARTKAKRLKLLVNEYRQQIQCYIKRVCTSQNSQI